VCARKLFESLEPVSLGGLNSLNLLRFDDWHRFTGCPLWTTENRRRYNRDKLRYPSDLTDDEWEPLEHLIPPAKCGGRRREVDVRDVLNGLMYVLSTGCQWRYIPGICRREARCTTTFSAGTLARIHYEPHQKMSRTDRRRGQSDIHDRDGGLLVQVTLFGLYPFLQKLFADGGYQGPQFRSMPTSL
jgi:transposase